MGRCILAMPSLGYIGNMSHIEPNVPLQSDDLDTLIQHELGLDEDPYETGLDLNESLKEVSCPYSEQEPNVSALLLCAYGEKRRTAKGMQSGCAEAGWWPENTHGFNQT